MSLPAFKIALFGLPKNIVVLAQNFDRFLVSWPRNDRGPLTFGIHDGIPDKRARMIPLGVLHGIGLGLSIVIFYKLDFLAKSPASRPLKSPISRQNGLQPAIVWRQNGC